GQKFHGLRPHLDGMVDLINLFGGYNPSRIYSLVIYGGFGYGYGWAEDQDFNSGLWTTELRGGLINSFHVSDAIDVNIELKLSKYDSGFCQEIGEFNNLMASANVGVAYKFNERGWQAPVIPVVVPVVPKYSDAEGDALVQRLQEANNRIKDLEEELAAANDALARAEAACKEVGPAYTIYFDINQSSLNACNKKVVKAMADAIKADPNTKYVITGYADKETGTDAYNAKLREARAQSVYKMLVKNGVNPDQLTTATDTKPLNKFNYVLDRAATIKVVK
ncbi:MAG: OmpA family protein, partial [Bacteroidaceae bacterium]|nr:OmpA family protein [Bacteroidaceae bacterium]